MSEEQEQGNLEQKKSSDGCSDGCAGCGCLIIVIVAIIALVKFTGCPWWAMLIILLLILR
jgi:hypothetical protein